MFSPGWLPSASLEVAFGYVEAFTNAIMPAFTGDDSVGQASISAVRSGSVAASVGVLLVRLLVGGEADVSQGVCYSPLTESASGFENR